METKEILHMTKGDGEFSYFSNTMTHKKFSRIIKPVLEKVIKSLLQQFDTIRPCTTLNVADLGCGVGPAPITFISTIVEIVHKISKEVKGGDCEVPEIQVYLSDLPSNDFNLLFVDVGRLMNGLSENGKALCFVVGAPGSFYDRLFPCNSMHLVHSYYAIHWLSQVPPGLCNEGKPMNKGKGIAAKSSLPQVEQAYYAQFQRDFTKFLHCRSHEVSPNGYMVLSTICRPSIEPMEPPSHYFLFQALNHLVSKGLIEEEKLDSLDLPIYYPCKEEIEEIVSNQGSFAIENLEVVLSDAQNSEENEDLAKITRSFTESLISNHFGAQIWNELYDVLCHVILENLESDSCPSGDVFNIIIVLKKKMG